MGACVSTKNNNLVKNTRSKKRKSSKVTISSSPSFIYIPQDDTAPARRMSGENYTEVWSKVLNKKKQLFSSSTTISQSKKHLSSATLLSQNKQHSSVTDFSQIYKKSGVVDKKLFLSTGFLSGADDIYSPTPSLLTPITPAYRVINSTFPHSLLSPTTPSPQFSPAFHAACYNTNSTRKPNSRRRPDASTNSRQHATTQESQATTYISEDRTEPSIFNFDEEAVKNVQMFYASSLRTEVIGMF